MDTSFDLPIQTNNNTTIEENEEDDYNDDADAEKLKKQMEIANQKKFQAEDHIPTHHQLKYGITKQKLIDDMSEEQKQRLNLEKDKIEDQQKESPENSLKNNQKPSKILQKQVLLVDQNNNIFFKK